MRSDARPLINALLTLPMALLLSGMVIWSTSDYLSLPIMQVNAITGTCMAVLGSSNEFSCANPPAKYLRESIAPLPSLDHYRDTPERDERSEIAHR